GGWPTVRVLQETVGQHQPGAGPLGRWRPPGVLLAIVVLGGVPILEASKLVLRPTGQFQVEDVLLKEVLATASAGEDRQEGIIVATRESLLRIVDGEEKERLEVRRRTVEGDHHLVEAPEEEMDLGPEERFAALLGRSPQDEVG